MNKLFIISHPGIRHLVDLLISNVTSKANGVKHVYLPLDVLRSSTNATQNEEGGEDDLPAGAVSLLAMVEEEIAVRCEAGVFILRSSL